MTLLSLFDSGVNGKLTKNIKIYQMFKIESISFISELKILNASS